MSMIRWMCLSTGIASIATAFEERSSGWGPVFALLALGILASWLLNEWAAR